MNIAFRQFIIQIHETRQHARGDRTALCIACMAFMNGGLPLMGVPLGADHPPGGCPQQPRQVVRNDRPVTASLRKGATTCMARHIACAGEDSRVTVGSTPTVYHRRPEARGVAAVTPGRKAPAAAGAHAFLGPACGAARVIPAQPGWSTLDAATSTGGLLGARRSQLSVQYDFD